jgi:hypothetical protein
MSIPSTGLSYHELHGLRPLAVSVSIARRLMGLGYTKIWEMIREKRLDVVRIDRRTLILYHSIERLLTPNDNEQPRQALQTVQPNTASSMTESRQSSGACAAGDRDLITKPATLRSHPNKTAATARSRRRLDSFSNKFPVGSQVEESSTNGPVTSSREK